jgi:hypothetical protein
MTLLSASSPVTSLFGASAVAPGTVLDNGAPKQAHSLQVITSAGVSAGVVALQVSNDNLNWFTTTASITTSAASTVSVATLADTPFQYVRANISTIITGGTVTAIVASAGT